MQVINEYGLINKRGSKVPAVINLGNKWPTGKANPLKRSLYLVLWLKWYTNHGEPRMIQHFPPLLPWSFGYTMSPARMLDKMPWSLQGCIFLANMICMSCQELSSLCGLLGKYFLSFLLFFCGVGIGEGIEVLQFWNSWWYIVHLALVTYWTLISKESMSVI